MSQQSYGPLQLPSGKKVTFRRPTGADKLDILQRTPIGSDDVVSGQMLVNAYIAAKCLQTVDGAAASGDYKQEFKSWDNADSEFYQGVFTKMFGMNEDTAAKIDEMADFLLNTSASGGTSTSPTPPTEA